MSTETHKISNERMEEIYEAATQMIVDQIFNEKMDTKGIQNEFEAITKSMIKEELNKNLSLETEPTSSEIEAVFKELRKVQREKLTSK